MLDDIELEKVQKIEIDEDQVLVEHEIPALEGDFFQGIGRRANRVSLTGVMTGTEAGGSLKSLRDKFRNADPVPFVSDITTATRVDQVLIEEMGVRELAGKPERFEYALTLREFIEAPEFISEVPPEPQQLDEEIVQDSERQVIETVKEIAENVGELRIQVEFVDVPPDFTNITVLVEGTTESGEEVYFTIDEQSDGVYTRQNVPAGEYTVSVFRR
jgi:hypothetical protein